MTTVRPLTVDDAAALTDLVLANREFMAPWEPARDPEFFTLAWQANNLAELESAREAGTTIPFVIEQDGAVAGRITLNNVVRGPMQSASVGYWVSGRLGGRGIASAALAALIPVAFGELGLHRLEAGTLVDNVRSQRVLTKNGFTQYGLAPQYLHIAGAWRDHLLFQRLNVD